MGGWTKLHNDQLHNLYSSQNIMTLIKSRRMRWTGYIEHRTYVYKICAAHYEEVNVDVR
jgi:hypothetical protein